MMNKMMVAGFACVALMGNSAVAQADPAVPMLVIEDSAKQFCGAIDAEPTVQGVGTGMNLIYERGLDEIDSALVSIVAIHHACPQHRDLILGLFDQVVAEEVCGKPVGA